MVAFVIVILVSIVVNLYVLVYWQSPQDKNDSYYAKAIVVRAVGLSPLAASAWLSLSRLTWLLGGNRLRVVLLRVLLFVRAFAHRSPG